MSDRLKRRKKAKDKESKPSEPAQAPLQPAYFDSATAPDEPTRAPEPEPEVSDDSGLIEAPEPEQAAIAAETASPSEARQGGQQRVRRRRTRGGRGRRSSGRSNTQAAPAQQAPAEPVVAAVPAPIPAAPPRPPKGTVVLAIGLPGSGKSSWFKRNHIAPLSSDMVRMLLFDDPQEQRFQDLVFSNLRSMLKARLIARRPLNYVDATNLTPHERSSWIKLAKDYGYDVQAVFFDVPLEVCLERNRRRDRVVDEEAMRRMSTKLKPPTFEEGFSKVTVVRVKKKEGEGGA